jgi:type II secretory pathway pseudopilin PulG
MGLGIAIIVISSVAWVDSWRKITQKIKIKKAMQAEQIAAKPSH